jgi:tetratricopeptide (TPR) repeat protein
MKYSLKAILLSLSLTLLWIIHPVDAYDPTAGIGEHIEAAQRYMEAKQWDYASYEWRNVLTQEPSNLAAQIGLGEALLQSGLTQEAIRELEQARQKKREAALELLLAKAYTQGGEPQLAKDLYEELLTQDPNHAQAYRGLVALAKLLPVKEKDQLEVSLKTKSKQVRPLAKQALKAAQYQEAAKYYEILSILEPKAGILNDYGLSLILAGQFEAADRLFRQLKLKIPQWQVTANAALADLSVGRTYEARVDAEKAIGRATDHKTKARLYNTLGYIYEAGRKFTKARYAYERSIALDPGFTKAYLNLGYTYQKDRDFEKAASLYRELIRRDPRNAEAWNQLGFTYELLHKPKQAIPAYQHAIALDPRLEGAYFNLGTLYKKLNKLDKASDIFKKMTDLEFNQIETAQKDPKLAEPKKSSLFKYVDLFISEPI